MKRALVAAALLAAGYAIGTIFMLVEYNFSFHFLGPALIRGAFIRAAFWMAVVPLAFILVRNAVRKSNGWLADAAIVSAICFAAALTAELAFLTQLAGTNGLRRPTDRQSLGPSAILPLTLTSVHAPFTLIVALTMVGRLLQMRAGERDGELRINQLETRLAEARLQLLQSQLHPHFLFNSLNSVAALIRHDGSEAGQMLQRLSRFYLIASRTEGRQLVTVQEEIGFVGEYLAIEQIRFGGRLTIEVAADPAALDARIPTLLLQPLVENAVKHGIARMPGPGWIRLGVEGNGETLRVSIANSGGDAGAGGLQEGVGLANTRQRLAQLYGGAFELRIETMAGTTLVSLVMPLGVAGETAA